MPAPTTTVVLPHLTIQQLEYVVAVADNDTWSDAAEDVGVSASALSQGMAELQRRLGVALFARDGRRMVARPEAEVVTSYARRVLAETRDLARWAEQTRSGASGRVAVGMIDAAAIHYFGDTLAAFRVDHPEVDLHLRVAPSARLVDDLRGGMLDLIVCVERADDSMRDLDVVTLIEEPLFVYAPEGEGRRRPAQWGPWVSFPADSHSRRVITAELRRLGASVEVVADSSQPEVLREMVRLGVGWAVLPKVEAERGPHPLAPARKSPLITRRLGLATRPNRSLHPAGEQLVRQLRGSDDAGSEVSASRAAELPA